MQSAKVSLELLQEVLSYYPDAKAELNYTTDFEFLIAVMLSAQTTDISVNKVTAVLFDKYSSLEQLMKADKEDVMEIIRPLGMYRNKTENIFGISKTLVEKYNGKVPEKREELVKLPGVGTKTANVVLATLYGYQYMAVDTHISRVCQRLKIVKKNSAPDEISSRLEKVLKNEDINQYHHSILFFGRYLCKAKNPECERCGLQDRCGYKINS